MKNAEEEQRRQDIYDYMENIFESTEKPDFTIRDLARLLSKPLSIDENTAIFFASVLLQTIRQAVIMRKEVHMFRLGKLTPTIREARTYLNAGFRFLKHKPEKLIEKYGTANVDEIPVKQGIKPRQYILKWTLFPSMRTAMKKVPIIQETPIPDE